MLHRCSAWRVLQTFFRQPTAKLSLAEISRQAGLAHTSVMKHLEELRRAGLIAKEKTRQGTRTYPVFKADQEAEAFRDLKRLDNLASLEKLTDYLVQHLLPECVVLFGSYSRGEDVEDSDIDIYVQAKDKQLDLKTFERQLSRKMHVIFSEKFSGYSKELQNNIINGVVLHGYLEAVQ